MGSNPPCSWGPSVSSLHAFLCLNKLPELDGQKKMDGWNCSTENYRADLSITQTVVPQVGPGRRDMCAVASTTTSQQEGPGFKAHWSLHMFSLYWCGFLWCTQASFHQLALDVNVIMNGCMSLLVGPAIQPRSRGRPVIQCLHFTFHTKQLYQKDISFIHQNFTTELGITQQCCVVGLRWSIPVCMSRARY